MATLDENGLLIRRFDEVLDDTIAALQVALSPNVKTNAESVLGNLSRVFAFHISEMEELAEDIRASGYLLTAEGASLDEIVARAGITRRLASASTVELTLGGTNGTIIPAGSTVRDPVALSEWTTDLEVTISGGTAVVMATASNTGPTAGLAGTITEIVDAVAGWTTVTNATDATLGANAETDAALRTRYLVQFTAARRSSDGLYADLTRITGVAEAVIIENRSSVTDANGLPPHSFRAIVDGGADQDIWDIIWEHSPQGIQSDGTESGIVVDERGDNQTVKFSRPTIINAHIEVTYTAGPNAPGDVEADILADVLAFGETLKLGDDLFPTQILQNIEAPGLQFLAVRVNTTGNPFLTDNSLGVDIGEKASADSSRVYFVQS